MPESITALAGPSQSWWQNPGLPTEVARYNAAAALHEHLIEKYCTLLGTTMAGVVNYEDRVAVNYLRSRPTWRSPGSDALVCRVVAIGRRSSRRHLTISPPQSLSV